MIYLLAAIALVVITRLAYRSYFPFVSGVKDTNGHLLYVKEIRKNRYRIPRRIERFLFDDNDYPEGFHWLMALTRLPLETLQKYGGHLPLLFDCLQLVLAFVMIRQLGGFEYGWLLLFPLSRLFWAYEDRAFHFGARAYGVLSGNLYLAGTFMFVQTPHWGWALLALAGFVAFSTSSQFAWQAAVFFTVIECLLLRTWEYAAVFGACFALSCLITRGYTWTVLLGLVRHSYFYKTHLLKTNWGITNFYGDWLALFKRFRFSRFEYLLFQNPLTKLFTNFPVSIPFLAIWASQGFPLSPLAVFCLCGIVLIPIIATEALKFLGEPDRYLDYSTVPVLVYLSFHPVAQHPVSLALAVTVAVWSIIFQIKLKKREMAKESSHDEGQQELLARVAELPPSTLLTISIRTSFYLGYYLEQHRYVTFLSNVGKDNHYQAYRDLCPDYSGFPGKDLSRYIKQYGIDYLIVSKQYLNILENKIGVRDYYDFTQYAPVYDSPHYVIYQTCSIPAPAYA